MSESDIRTKALQEAEAVDEDDVRTGEEQRPASPEVAEHYQEMTERGKNQQGEGKIPD